MTTGVERVASFSIQADKARKSQILHNTDQLCFLHDFLLLLVGKQAEVKSIRNDESNLRGGERGRESANKELFVRNFRILLKFSRDDVAIQSNSHVFLDDVLPHVLVHINLRDEDLRAMH